MHRDPKKSKPIGALDFFASPEEENLEAKKQAVMSDFSARIRSYEKARAAYEERMNG